MNNLGNKATTPGLILLITLLLTACSDKGAPEQPVAVPAPEPVPEPRALVVPIADLGGWEQSQPPAAVSTALATLADDIDAGDHSLIDGIAIAKDGELLFDLTFRETVDRFDVDVGNTDLRLHALMSVSKSLTGLLVGVAIENDGLPGVETPYLELFPGRTFANPSPEKSAMTLQHVLQMQLGLDWDEWSPPYNSPDNQLNRFLRDAIDHTEALLDLPMIAMPGEAFGYNTIATTTLGDAIQGFQPLALEDFAATWLLLPLDITQFAASRTPTGLPELGRGVFLSNRDVLKFGQVLLDKGKWRGTRIVSEAWLQEMLTPWTTFVVNEPGSAWTPTGYGYLWWLGDLQTDSGLHETWVARGYGDQLLVVIDDLDIVIAITSHAYDTARRENELFTLIADRIIPAITAW